MLPRRQRVLAGAIRTSTARLRPGEEQWGEVERVFVDNPERSIEMADRTVSDVLVERNFVSDAGQSDE